MTNTSIEADRPLLLDWYSYLLDWWSVFPLPISWIPYKIQFWSCRKKKTIQKHLFVPESEKAEKMVLFALERALKLNFEDLFCFN